MNNKFFLELKKLVINNHWVEGKGKGNNNVGITFESLLNKEVENFELPDYKGIEIKTKYSKKECYISLFNCTPDSYLFEIKRLHLLYGYPDKEFPQFNIFNISIYGNRKIRLNNTFFKLYVDRINQKVFLRIYDTNNKIIDELTSWSFEILNEKLQRKLKYLALIQAEKKYINNKIYFKYNNIDFYSLISFDKFLWLIEMGMIRVTFRIGIYKSKDKLGKMYDHGTCFNIEQENIDRLFNKIDVGD